MRIQNFRSLLPIPELISSLSTFTISVKKHYVDYVRKGFYQEIMEPCMYVYQYQHESGSHTGLLCNTSLQDSIDEKIIKHENTLASKEQDMMYMITERKAMIKPILMTYPTVSGIEDFLNSVKTRTCDLFLDDPERSSSHSFWRLTPEESNQMKARFLKIEQAYIADGHHRHAVLRNMYDLTEDHFKESYEGLFTVYFSFDQLDVWDYNRIVHVTENISDASIIAKLSKYFDVEILSEWQKPKEKYELTLMMNYENYRLRWKESIIKSSESSTILDTELFNQHVLKEIFDVVDIREDSRISYIEGILSSHEVIQNVYKQESRIGFFLYPVEMKDLIALADRGDTLPPKSTWFEPRIMNGLISQVF